MDEFEKEFGIRPYKISAVTHEGVDDLLRYIASQVPEMEPFSEEEENLEEEFVEFHPAQDVEQRDLRHVGIEKIPEGWELKNQRLERMVRQTDFSSESARERIYDVLRKWSVFKKLKKLGAKADDQIRIGEHLWEFRE